MNRSLLQHVVRNVEARAAKGPAGLGDAELLRRFAEARDEAAFNVLVARHGPLVWAVCRNLLPTEAEAEDAFQATFLALIQSARRVRTSAVGPWLYGVAVRVARMANRSAGRRRRREVGAAAREATAPVAAAEWDELQAAVHEEVGRLPETLRVAFVLCGLQGKSQRDVAAELGWKPGTLSGRLSKARQQLLERLSKRGVAAGSVVAAVVGGGAAGAAGAPASLVAQVAALARTGAGNGISPAILELAQAATEVTMTRMKLFCVTVALMGCAVVGLTFLPLGTAQEKIPQPAGATDVDTGRSDRAPAKSSSGGTSATTKAGAWEYKYIARKSDRLDDFRRLLASNSADGWEFVGTETLQIDDGSAAGPVLVFKRPNAPRPAMTGLNPGMGMSGMGMGPGFGGPSLSGGISGMGGFSGGTGNLSGSSTRPSTSAGPGLGGQPVKPGSSSTASEKKRDVQVVPLKHAAAASLAKSLHDLFGDGSTRIIAEQQSNSLLIQADAKTSELLMKLIERLDVQAAKKN